MSDSIGYLLHTQTLRGSITVNGHIAMGLSPSKYFEKIHPGKDHRMITAHSDKTRSTHCVRLIGEHEVEMLSVLGGDGDYLAAFEQAAMAYRLSKKNKVLLTRRDINITALFMGLTKNKVFAGQTISIDWNKGSYELTTGSDTHKFNNLDGFIGFIQGCLS